MTITTRDVDPTDTPTRSWRDELRRPQLSPDARCGCGHTRIAHAGDPNGRLLYPDACSVMICGCELFRGEADR